MSPQTCQQIAGSIEDWPQCSVPDCPNKANLWIGRDMCFPHSLDINLGDWEKACAAGHKARHDIMNAHAGAMIVQDEISRGIMCDYLKPQ